MHAAFVHDQHHFRAHIILRVSRWTGEIAFFVAEFVAQVRPPIDFEFSSRVPCSFFRIDVIKAVVRALVESNVIENEKLRFWAEEDGVANACCFEVFFGFLRNVAGIA